MDKNMEISWEKAVTTAFECTTAAFLAALMWRRPLNSVFNYHRPQETRKAAQQDRYLSAGLDDKQVDDGNELVRTI